MSLVSHHFFKNRLSCVNHAGERYEIDRYGYESRDRLYDVDVGPFGTFFRVNGRDSVVQPIHRQIIQKYLQGRTT